MGCLGGPPRAGTPSDEVQLAVNEGFESGLDDWEVGAAIGPEVDVADFEYGIERTAERAFQGQYSLSIFTEGSYDDGTAWLVRPVEVEPGRAYETRVAVHAWSESESFNTTRNVVAYLGPERPEAEADFPAPGENSAGGSGLPAGGLREPLDQAAGWNQFSFTWETPTLSTGRLFLAVGTSVVWETDRTDYFDEVVLELGRL